MCFLFEMCMERGFSRAGGQLWGAQGHLAIAGRTWASGAQHARLLAATVACLNHAPTRSTFQGWYHCCLVGAHSLVGALCFFAGVLQRIAFLSPFSCTFGFGTSDWANPLSGAGLHGRPLPAPWGAIMQVLPRDPPGRGELLPLRPQGAPTCGGAHRALSVHLQTGGGRERCRQPSRWRLRAECRTG